MILVEARAVVLLVATDRRAGGFSDVSGVELTYPNAFYAICGVRILHNEGDSSR